MESPGVYFAIQVCAAAVLFVAGIPFAMNRVKPNMWSGFRTERTLADPKVWYRVNRDMGLDLMGLGVVYAICIAVTYAFREMLGFNMIWIANLAVLFGGLGWMVYHGFRTMGKM